MSVRLSPPEEHAELTKKCWQEGTNSEEILRAWNYHTTELLYEVRHVSQTSSQCDNVTCPCCCGPPVRFHIVSSLSENQKWLQSAWIRIFLDLPSGADVSSPPVALVTGGRPETQPHVFQIALKTFKRLKVLYLIGTLVRVPVQQWSLSS